mmetsp:Transcript_20582/g.78910  ORF Transcript_20582/g.78910 Transcript_20582/m.78910 type:complete len:435 (+) Transcript_20582:148-1452(+)
MNELLGDSEQKGGAGADQRAQQQQLMQAHSQQQSLAARRQLAAGGAGGPTDAREAARVAQAQAALLNPQFVNAVRQKIQSPDFQKLPPESQQKLLHLRQQIARAARLQQLQRANGQQARAPPSSSSSPSWAQAGAGPSLGDGQAARPSPSPGSLFASGGGAGGGGGGAAVAFSQSSLPLAGQGRPQAATGAGAGGGGGGAALGGVHMGGAGQARTPGGEGTAGTAVATVGVKREREEGAQGSAAAPPAQETKGERHKRMLMSYMKDTQRALRPDYRTPFTSTEDVCQRLLAYHKFSQAAGYTEANIKADLDQWKEEYPKKCEELVERMKKVAETTISSAVNNAAADTPEEGYLAAILERYEAAQYLKDVRGTAAPTEKAGQAGQAGQPGQVGQAGLQDGAAQKAALQQQALAQQQLQQQLRQRQQLGFPGTNGS